MASLFSLCVHFLRSRTVCSIAICVAILWILSLFDCTKLKRTLSCPRAGAYSYLSSRLSADKQGSSAKPLSYAWVEGLSCYWAQAEFGEWWSRVHQTPIMEGLTREFRGCVRKSGSMSHVCFWIFNYNVRYGVRNETSGPILSQAPKSGQNQWISFVFERTNNSPVLSTPTRSLHNLAWWAWLGCMLRFTIGNSIHWHDRNLHYSSITASCKLDRSNIINPLRAS